MSPAELRPVLGYDRLYDLTLVADGPADQFPSPLGLPDLSEGPHLGYTFQWFSLCAVGLIGWTAIVVTAVRGRSGSARRRRGSSAHQQA